MAPPTFTRVQLAQVFLDGLAAAIKKRLNVQDGNLTKATANAVGSAGTILQNMSQYTIAISRASTSVGIDLDSFLAQFGYTRNPATNAYGNVILYSVLPATQPVNVPIGTVLQTQGALIKYTIIADPNQPNYNVLTSSYVLAIGQTQMVVTAQAQVAGSGGSVQAGQLTQIVPTIFGISSVSNPQPIINGISGESDADFLARFQQDFFNKAKGTFDAITAALLKAGCTKVKLISGCVVVGNPATGLLEKPNGGWVNAVVDNGSTAPSAVFLDKCRATVASTMAFGFFGPVVVAPEILSPSIQIPLRFADATQQLAIFNAVKTAVLNYTNVLPIGGLLQSPTLNIGDLIQVAKDAHPAILAIDENNTLINARNEDLILQPWQELSISYSNISLSRY